MAAYIYLPTYLGSIDKDRYHVESMINLWTNNVQCWRAFIEERTGSMEETTCAWDMQEQEQGDRVRVKCSKTERRWEQGNKRLVDQACARLRGLDQLPK